MAHRLTRWKRTRTVDHLGDDTLASFVATADGVVDCFHENGAIGADETLDDDVVGFLLAPPAGLDLGPQQRAFTPPDADAPRNASPQDQLLHRLGRQPNVTEETQ